MSDDKLCIPVAVAHRVYEERKCGRWKVVEREGESCVSELTGTAPCP